MNYKKGDILICIKKYVSWVNGGEFSLFVLGNHYLISDVDDLVIIDLIYASYNFNIPFSLSDVQEHFETIHVRRSRIIEELI